MTNANASSVERDAKSPPVLQSKVTTEVRREIDEATAAFGFDSLAEGVRMVMKAFARSQDVRDAVERNLRLALPDTPPAKAPAA